MGTRDHYQFIAGSLDDLDALPRLRPMSELTRRKKLVGEGRRNGTLFEHCMKQGHHCDDLDSLVDVARSFNERSLMPPLDDGEVKKIAKISLGLH